MVDKTTGFLSQPNEGDQDADTSENPFNEKQLKAISTLVNSAISGRNKDFEKKLDKQFEAFSTKLEQLVKPAEVNDPPAPSKKKPDPETAQLISTVESLKAANEKSRAKVLDAAIKTTCVEAKISPEVIPALTPFLKAKFTYASEDSDEIVWREDDENLSPQEGMQRWVKNDPAANHFLSVAKVVGSGDTNYSNGQKPAGNEIERGVDRLLGLTPSRN